VDITEDMRKMVMGRELSRQASFEGTSQIGQDRFGEWADRVDGAVDSVARAYKLVTAFGDNWRDSAAVFGWKQSGASNGYPLRSLDSSGRPARLAGGAACYR